ncbi:RHS repeat-associated core domain-containing protein [Streptomyces cylindrosporus]|uniref:RHS repeat-associated core domain-containing protein n=1 Tax=Streptomyces cylindrosporus TaxID=2927583 RepID=A0ABS9YHB0_9ACTN|nr:RHS repeat-associated core domain-containing protein [Streptomyces cylindrosporus]MCI3276570.1 RHS repeat-associated core domain-containing protein [Streptomyces cylindrosporus]
MNTGTRVVRWLRGRRAGIVVTLAVALATGALPAVQPAQAASGGLGRPDLPEQRDSDVRAVTGLGAQKARTAVAAARARNSAQARRATAEQHAAWPKPARTTVPVPAGRSARTTTKPGGLPVTVAPGSVGNVAGGDASIRVLDRGATAAAGVKGVLLTATATEPGRAHLTLDYSGFASAYGGGWSGRLGLVRLPACALTTPEKAACRTRTPLSSDNDVDGQTVSADVALASASSATVLALAATSGTSTSGAGDYSATSLSSSSTWEAGGSSGAFTWSYPLSTPPAAVGPQPDLELSYDSGGIDGRTASTNNQSTSVGEGFELSSGSYVERSYGSCDKDGQSGKSDLCWKYDNASLVLGGKSSELVKDDTTGVWRLKNDDASTVTHSTGADNGDGNGEYWTVTTGEGTKYVFGLNKLTGAGTERTNSVWTVPVYGDDSGEPGYDQGSAFADRSTTQAWRWNLDYVEDLNGNAMTYWYTPETNYYGKNGASTATTEYIRGGHLDKILYGQRADTLFTGVTSDKVTFTYEERCTASDCSELKDSTADNWPDVPADAICKKDANCDVRGPFFFTRKRLTQVDTYAWSAASSAFTAVDTWALTQEFLDGGDIGDTSDQTLVLKSLRHTGKNGTAVTLPPVTFTYQMRENRVDATDDILPLSRPRIESVTSETGSITRVTLSEPECVRGSNIPAKADHNAKSCYPQFWNINGAEEASIDWFHKYRVLAVDVSDPTGHNDAVEYQYSYTDPAWHYDDNPFTPADERTWSVFRGYGQVTATKGTGTTRSKTVSLYLQGMNGDRLLDADGELDASARRSASVAGVDVSGLDVADQTDNEPYAGFLREKISYDGSTPVSVTVHDPWSKKTATQHKSYADTEAYFVREAKAYTHTYLTATAKWRTRTTATTYDAYGMAATVDDAGDTAKSGDETCTRNWYARNDSLGITALPSRTRVVGRSCSVAETALNLPTSAASPGDVLSDTATVYDNTSATAWSAAQTPTLGLATWKGRASAYPAGATDGERPPTSWQTVSKTAYDTSTVKLGRPVSVTDAAGNTTSAAYTPTDAGPLTRTVITNPKSQKSYTYLDPARGSKTKVYDVNTKLTETAYDALGRVTSVWLPNRSHSSDQSANYTYAYSVTPDAPSWTSTSTLKADGSTYNTTYSIYDALLRPLQTQSPSPLGGRLLTDTRYDSRGLAYETYAQIFDQDKTPNGTYTRAEYGEAAQQTATTFDGAERATGNSLYVYGVKRWTTSTEYTGDSTATTALAGGSATRLITDALGRTVERREYAGTSPADSAYGAGTGSAYTSTSFSYTLDGKESTITGPDGSVWSYGYDLYGRKVTSTDPDKGKTTTGYTNLDQVSWIKDAAGRVVISAYDTLGRVSGTWSAPATADLTSTTEEQVAANQLTAYTYDTAAKGQLDTAVRYVGGSGSSGTAYTKKVTAYDALYHPTGTQIVLPAGDALVTSGAVPSATLDFSSYYNVDGTRQYTKEPAAGGLAAEQINTDYNAVGLPTTVSGASGYVLGTSYSALGETEQLTLGTSSATGTKKAYITNTFEEGTGRLKQSAVTDQTHGYELQELNYAYDDAGNVTSILDPTTRGGASAADNQCFAYDGHQRLTEAWTPKTADCSAAGRTTANLGGASPYWTSYEYQDSGLRSTETTHATGGDTKKTYCYDSTRKHALAAVITAASCTGVTPAYAYDTTGNTTTRPDGSAAQTLVWNEEGDLGKLVEGSSTTGYVYDADGSLLIRRNTAGETVLYLGATEVHLDTSTSTAKYWAQRYYTAGESTVALRSNKSGSNTLTWLAADRHGTSTLALESATQAVTKRYSTPFGGNRSGGTGTWADDKGFLGKTSDTDTGLTHLGAREYDPVTGRFVSVDPVLTTDQGQSLNGYTYANNNPVTQSDPTGLESCYPHFCSGSNGTYGTYKPENDPESDQYDGSSHDGPAPPVLGAATGNKTTRHNQARDVAIEIIKMQVKKLGVKNFVIYKNLQVQGAAKKCMKTPALPCGSYGVPDIVGYDPNHDIYYVWEVKSAGVAAKAVPEANWYVGKMRANGDKAVLGWTIGGPYPVVNGDRVIGPEPGAVIYGKPNDKKFKRIPTPSPMTTIQQAQPAQPTPQPTPGPTAGPYPGTIDQPGLGIVPQATDGVNQWPLLVPIVVVGAPLIVEGGGTAAAVSVSAGVAASLFELAA